MSDINLEQFNRAEAIAASWYQALLDSGDVYPTSRAAQPELLDITRQIIALTSKDQFQNEAARAIGECLAQLGYQNVDIIGKVPALLNQVLTQDLDPIQVNTINTRLANVLTQVIAGFLDQKYQAALVEKEHALQSYEAEWKRASADRQELEQKSQAILQALPDTLGIVTLDGDVLFYHAGSEKILLYSREAKFKDMREYLHADIVEELLSVYKQVVDTGQPRMYEFTDTFEQLGKLYFQDIISPYTENTVLVISRDITKQKRIEEDLRTSEARYRSVVEDQLEYIARWTPGAVLTFVNKAVCTLMGMEYEQLIGTDFDDFIRPIDEDEARKLYAAFATMTPENPISQGRLYALVHNQHARWLEWRTRASFNDAGEAIEFQTVANDITDIKQAQDELRESEARYRSLVEAQTELICRFDRRGVVTFINEAGKRMFREVAHEVIGHNIWEYLQDIDPVTNQKVMTATYDLTPQNPSLSTELKVLGPSNQIMVLGVTTKAIFNEQGEAIEFQTTGRDVTDLKRIEAALRESEERYRSVVEGQSELIARFLPDGTITFVNEAMCRFFSKSRQEILGSSALGLIYEQDQHHIVQALENLQNNSSQDLNKSYQTRVILANGEIRWVESITSAITRPDGSFSEFQVVARDINDLKLAQETLEQQNELLHQLSDQLINVQELERQRIARDLHDSVLNELGAMMVAPTEALTPKSIRDKNEKMIEQLRQTINGLRSPMLNYGLYAALEELSDNLMDALHNGNLCEIDIPASLARFDSDVELHLFRIVQQACDNALQHAQAHRIRISGTIDPGCVNLWVEDDGIGFQLGAEMDLAHVLAKKHFGLVSMLERGKLIGADVHITSRPGAGTQVHVLWELQNNNYYGDII